MDVASIGVNAESELPDVLTLDGKALKNGGGYFETALPEMVDQFRREFLTHACQTATWVDLPNRINVSRPLSRILRNTDVACKAKDATHLLETHASAGRGHVDCHAPGITSQIFVNSLRSPPLPSLLPTPALLPLRVSA